MDVSPDLTSRVTDAVVAEIASWQSRPVEPLYPVVLFDAVRVNILTHQILTLPPIASVVSATLVLSALCSLRVVACACSLGDPAPLERTA